MSTVVHERFENAAHGYGGVTYDVETWTYAQPERLPVPAGVPQQAEYRGGHRDAQGVQHWTYIVSMVHK